MNHNLQLVGQIGANAAVAVVCAADDTFEGVVAGEGTMPLGGFGK